MNFEFYLYICEAKPIFMLYNSEYVPVLQVRNSALVIYYDCITSRPKSSKNFNFKESAVKTYSGEITAHAAKRLKRAISLLLMASPKTFIYNPVTKGKTSFRLVFVTLTLHNAIKVKLKEAYELLLKPFLRVARKKWGVVSYIWKAEYNKNGQLHYHLTTNKFIQFSELRDGWNLICKRANLLEEFYNKFGHYNPNSTDIHKVYKIKDVEAYLAKYMSKSIGDEKESGKVWGCSDNLRGKKYPVFYGIGSTVFEDINKLENENFIKHVQEVTQCSYLKMKQGISFEDILERNEIKLIRSYINSEIKLENSNHITF